MANITVRTVDRKDEWFKRISPVINQTDGSIDGYELEFFESGDSANLRVDKIFIASNPVGIRMVGEGGYHLNELRHAFEGKTQEWLAANTEIKSIELFTKGPQYTAGDSSYICAQKQLADGTWIHDGVIEIGRFSAYQCVARIQGVSPDGWWMKTTTDSSISLEQLKIINGQGDLQDTGDGVCCYSDNLRGTGDLRSMRNDTRWHGFTIVDCFSPGLESLRKVVITFHNIAGSEHTGKFSLGRQRYNGADTGHVCTQWSTDNDLALPFANIATVYVNSQSETTIVYQNKEYGWNSSKLHPSTDGKIVICDVNGQDHEYRIDMQGEEATMALVKLIRAGGGEDTVNINDSI